MTCTWFIAKKLGGHELGIPNNFKSIYLHDVNHNVV